MNRKNRESPTEKIKELETEVDRLTKIREELSEDKVANKDQLNEIRRCMNCLRNNIQYHKLKLPKATEMHQRPIGRLIGLEIKE